MYSGSLSGAELVTLSGMFGVSGSKRVFVNTTKPLTNGHDSELPFWGRAERAYLTFLCIFTFYICQNTTNRQMTTDPPLAYIQYYKYANQK
jgi:hypothetical protein